jgi:hypothetical protein
MTAASRRRSARAAPPPLAAPLLWSLLAVAASLAACRRTPPPPPKPALASVSVSDLTPSEGAPAHVDVGRLERELRARLLASGLFADAPASASGNGGADLQTRARGEVAVDKAEVGDKGLARVRVRVRLDTRPSEVPGAIEEQLEGQGEQPYAVTAHAAAVDRSALFDTLTLRVMGDLVGGFIARRKLRDGPADAVHAALAGDGGELREEAIHVAGQRQLRQEVPTLLKLLDDPDESTRDAALGALIVMRERSAVSALTRTRSLRDRREMRKIIEAIAILGGQEAEEYLSFVAQTHDDDEIRAEAAAAKARLERHAADGANRP